MAFASRSGLRFPGIPCVWINAPSELQGGGQLFLSAPILFGLRLTAGEAGFLTLIQSNVRPERYGEPLRLETMPSTPHHAGVPKYGPVRLDVVGEMQPVLDLVEDARERRAAGLERQPARRTPLATNSSCFIHRPSWFPRGKDRCSSMCVMRTPILMVQ
jgi:hypothetical protein